MPAKQPAQKKAKQVDIVLLKDHKHAGKAHKQGATIQVPETLLPWMRAQKIIAEEAK